MRRFTRRAALVVVLAALGAGSTTAVAAASCNALLGCTQPGPAGPWPDPGGSETTNVPVPPPGGKLIGFSSNVSVEVAGVTPAQEYGAARAAGANIHRMDVHWSVAEPAPGQYTYAPEKVKERYDAILAHGMKPLIILQAAPKWASDCIVSPGADCNTGWPPNASHLADWERFARKMATDFPQAAFEIWNEPNLKQFYRTGANPSHYFAILKGAYNAIKAVNPAATVLTAGLSDNHVDDSLAGNMSALTFLSKLYQAGLATMPDLALGYHVYPYGADLGAGWGNFARSWADFRTVLGTYGDYGRSVWITETGVATAGSAAVSEPVQADVMRRIYNRLMTIDQPSATNPNPVNVRAVVFHALRDRQVESAFGFLKGATYPWTPKPAFCWMVKNAAPGSLRAYAGC